MKTNNVTSFIRDDPTYVNLRNACKKLERDPDYWNEYDHDEAIKSCLAKLDDLWKWRVTPDLICCEGYVKNSNSQCKREFLPANFLADLFNSFGLLLLLANLFGFSLANFKFGTCC